MRLNTAVQALALAGLLATGATASAAVVISVQTGGITITGQNTGAAGTQGDPWTVAERMASHGHLQFTGERSGLEPGNPTGSGHVWGKWVSKTVTNDTQDVWTSFELELQAVLEVPSGQGDGLSFADGSNLTGLFNSDKFSGYTRQEVTRDYLNFSGGAVNPGESVTFNFVITDNATRTTFWLLQTPNKTDIPEPATLALVGLALAGAGLARRRKA